MQAWILMKHSYQLDSLRGLLSLLVVMQHVATAFIYSKTGLNSPINTYLGLTAHYSVLFFFALSGYVITLSIKSNIERNNNFNSSEYIISRVSRIIPPLLGTLLFSWILYLALVCFNATTVTGNFQYKISSVFNPDILTQLKSIFTLTISGDLIGGNGNINAALWSLVFEIQFYVYAALITLILTSKKIFIRLLSLLALSAYAYYVIPTNVLTMQITSYFCFAFGSLSFIYRDVIAKRNYIIILTFVALIISIGIQTEWSDTIQKLRDNVPKNGEWMVYRVIMGGFFALLIIHIQKIDKFINLFHKLSTYSYSLYILHFPIVTFIWFILVNHAQNLLVFKYSCSIATVIIIIFITKYFGMFFERPKEHRNYLMHITKPLLK